MTDRPPPVDCQHEPPYPLLPTVLMSLAAPHLVAHSPRSDCQIEEPHRIEACGYFNPKAFAEPPPENPK